MMTVDIRYKVICDDSGYETYWLPWTIELTDVEYQMYCDAINNHISFEEIPELMEALKRVHEEIEEYEIDEAVIRGDEYVLACLGEVPADPDDINDLIYDGYEYALEFFGLTDADEDELDEWDANELDELPLMKDFIEDFVPLSPFDDNWSLIIEYTDED